MLYLIQVTAYTGLMCLLYVLFLRNKPVHGFNRGYLLLSVFAPLVLPFISIPAIADTSMVKQAAFGLQLPEFVVSSAHNQGPTQRFNVAGIVYFAITALLLFVLVYQIVKLKLIISKHNKVVQQGYTLVHNTSYGPGSWFNYILLPEAGTDNTIIQHELAHVKHRHTIDIIAINIVQALCWPNLFLIWIKRELKQVHEFQADAGIAIAPVDYANLLLSGLFKTCALPNTHSFIIHPIKRRIMMLNKNGRKKWNALNVGLAVTTSALVLTSIISVQSCKEKKWEVKQTNNVTTTEVSKKEYDEYTNNARVLGLVRDRDFNFVIDKMPQFLGGNSALTDFMMENVKYPKEAKERGIEGKVIVSFIVDEHGTVKDPEVFSTNGQPGIDPLLAAEAIRVVNSMPAWQPGMDKGKAVSAVYRLPITFKL